ncbi:hypothetical protein B5P41_34880 [Bacillus sp. SRB_28]|nr:hypothetical protein B5P41_34880 [Bacillus sp. SRB_28]
MSAARLTSARDRECQISAVGCRWRTAVDPAERQGCKRNTAVYGLDRGADVGPPSFFLVRGLLQQTIHLYPC